MNIFLHSQWSLVALSFPKQKLFPLLLCPTLPKEFLPCEFKGYHRRCSLIVRPQNQGIAMRWTWIMAPGRTWNSFCGHKRVLKPPNKNYSPLCKPKCSDTEWFKACIIPKTTSGWYSAPHFRFAWEKTQWWQSKENHNFSPYTRTSLWIIKLPWSLMLGVQRIQAKFRSPSMIKDFFENWKHQSVDILVCIKDQQM